MVARQTRPQLGPKSLIGPVRDRILQRTLHVVAAACSRAHAAERKPSGMVGIHQLITHGRYVGHYPQPAEWIKPLVEGETILRHACAAHAMRAITAGDEVAAHFL